MTEDKTMRAVEYKTIDDIKLDIIKRIVTVDEANLVSITRCYETLTGSLIARGVGESAPAGKFKVIS